MLHSLQFVTIIYGLICTTLPAVWAYWFFVKGKDLIGRRIAYMLVGESISMGMAVFFAVNSFYGVYNTMSPELVMVLRWVIFTTALVTTVKLVMYLRESQKDHV